LDDRADVSGSSGGADAGRQAASHAGAHPRRSDAPIVWSPDRRLAWADFRARAPGTLEGALSGLSYSVTVGCRGGELRGQVVAVFLPDQSWVADRIVRSGLATRVGLRHEQLHFDVKELFARRMRRMFRELRDPCPRSDDALFELTAALRREEQAVQQRIERDTQGGEIEARQIEWEERIAAELRALAGFSSVMVAR
jgi:hypothetical protein